MRCVPVILAGLASLLPLSCGDKGASPSTDPYAAQRSACVGRINQLRATIGLPALSQWTDGQACADEEAANDAMTGTAHGAFGHCGESAQNECPGYGDVGSITTTCLTYMWNEGPGQPYSQHGHYINMTNPAYSKVAIGFYAPSGGSVWAVMDFK